PNPTCATPGMARNRMRARRTRSSRSSEAATLRHVYLDARKRCKGSRAEPVGYLADRERLKLSWDSHAGFSLVILLASAILDRFGRDVRCQIGRASCRE